MEARGVLEDKDQAENNNSSVDLTVMNKTSSDVTIPHGSGSDENSNLEVTMSSEIPISIDLSTDDNAVNADGESPTTYD